jgi:hypothetical protein
MASSVAEVAEVKEVREAKQIKERAPFQARCEDAQRMVIYDP